MVDVPESEAAEPQQSLRLLVKGFTGFDMRLLEGVVKLSKRRNPSLELVDGAVRAVVDVVMIDGKDEEAVAWAHTQQDWLAKRAVVWVDAQRALPPCHTGLQRPVNWTNLPVILSRAMDDAAHYAETAAAAQAASSAQAAAAAQKAQAAQIAQMAHADHIMKQGKVPAILVVDDSAAVRGHLESALKTVGYEVTAVDSGEAAIMAVGMRHYDCILMDVLMPGIDGYEACRKIKSMPMQGGSRPPIVMLTSKSSPFDRIRGKMAGCDAYLTKPVQRSHLMQVLAQHAFKNMAVHA